MRTRNFAAAATLALAFAPACDTPTAPVAAVRHSAGLAVQEKGTGVFAQENDPFFIDCLDEVVIVTVTMPYAYHIVTTPSGNTSYVDRFLSTQGTGTMVGTASGTTWTLQRIISPFNLLVIGAGERVAFEANQWWVSDSGQRLHAHSTYFLRHDADGNLVAEREVYRCRVF